MADQFAYHAMGCITPCVQTPNLDALAQRAVRFERCYSNSPLCMPARASLATGLYPQELSISDNYAAGLTPESRTWMQRIERCGYETSVFGKVHLHRFCDDLRARAPQTQGYGYQIVDELPGPRTYGTKRSSYYDHLRDRGLLECYQADMKKRYETGYVYDCSPTPLPTRDYADVYIADRALEYLSAVPSGQPWFCTVSFGGPHDPWDTPAEYAARYRDVVPSAPLAAPSSKNPARPRGVYDEILNGEYDPSLTEDIRAMTPADIAALRRSYYGHVTLIDEQIGRIFACLEKRGMLDNTIVVFTADHGEENGDYGLLFKQTFFESSIRVPLLIAEPGRGAVNIDQPVELMDIGATLCQMLGADGAVGHAASLIPAMQGRLVSKACIAAQLFGETMLLENGWKAVFNRAGEIYLLFHLQDDPEERVNLAASEDTAQIEAHFKQRFAAWQEGLIDTGCTAAAQEGKQ